MISFLNSSLQAAAPIVLVAVGGVFAHRAGILHLGLEGLMIIGAFVATAVTIKSGSIWLGLGAAIAVDLVVSALFWLLVVVLRANVFIAGLGLSIAGLGITAFLLEVIFKTEGAIQTRHGLPRPISGPHGGVLGLATDLSVIDWATPVLVVLAWVVLRRSRLGLRVAAAGEYPFAARSAGVDVARIRLAAVAVTGFFCALGGADLALASVRSFSEDMTQGRGYLAFTAILFGAEHPLGAAAAALFFGLAEALGIQSQLGLTKAIPIQFVLMVPYLITIVAIATSSAWRKRLGLVAGTFAELRD